MRIRMLEKISSSEQEVLEYALSSIAGIRNIQFYRSTGGIAITYDGDRDILIRKLKNLRFDNVVMMAKEEEKKTHIGKEELMERKISPELQKRLRRRIMAETVADVVFPWPVQVAIHAYRLITLRDIF